MILYHEEDDDDQDERRRGLPWPGQHSDGEDVAEESEEAEDSDEEAATVVLEADHGGVGGEVGATVRGQVTQAVIHPPQLLDHLLNLLLNLLLDLLPDLLLDLLLDLLPDLLLCQLQQSPQDDFSQAQRGQ